MDRAAAETGGLNAPGRPSISAKRGRDNDAAHLSEARTTPAVLAGAISLVGPGQALAQGGPQREAFFGQTHVHTSWSFDAYILGNTLNPNGYGLSDMIGNRERTTDWFAPNHEADAQKAC